MLRLFIFLLDLHLILACKIAEIPDLVYYGATFLPWSYLSPYVAAHIFQRLS